MGNKMTFLLDHVSQPVKPKRVVQNDFEEEEDIDTGLTNDDFEEPGWNGDESEQEEHREKGSSPNEDELSAEDLADPEETADILIDAYDSVNMFVYPIMYDAAMFTKDERQRLKGILQKVDEASSKKPDGDQSITITFTEQELLKRYDESAAYADEIVPLNEREINSIKKPLVRYIRTINFKASPLGALIFTVFITSIPRVLPILGAWYEKRKRRINAG